MPSIEHASHRLDLNEYLAAQHELPGWFSDLDALLFACFDEVQRNGSVRGDLLEIGVYRGKSAALLGYFVREGERLVVCDLFDSAAPGAANVEENERFYPDLSRKSFEDTFLRFHRRLPEVFQCDSTELQGSAGLQRGFRFIHVDGSHLYDIVRQDIATAHALLVEGGLVVFDDFCRPHTPGVAAAVWEAVAARTIRPICITDSKMYASCGDVKLPVLPSLNRLIAVHTDLHMESHSLYGTDFVRIYRSTLVAPWAKQVYWGLLSFFRRTRPVV